MDSTSPERAAKVTSAEVIYDWIQCIIFALVVLRAAVCV